MKKILTFIFGPVITAILEIRLEIRGLEEKLQFKTAAADLFHVARNTGFVLFPALLSGAIFLFLPQGRDTLLLVVEKMDTGDYTQLCFFLVAIVIWSMFSELSIRYAIAIADNSGKSLRDSRVYWRKLSQRFLASFSLLWPPLMVILALIWCYNSATYLATPVKLRCFGLFISALLLVFRLLSYFYFHRKPRHRNDPARTILGGRSLPKNEYDWVNRLYGIYNEYVYTLPKPANFIGKYEKDMDKFANHVTNSALDFRNKIPQNGQVMNPIRLLPKEFELINDKNVNPVRGDSYRWRYRIPNSFYPVLHRYIGGMSIIAVLVLLGIALVPAGSGFFGEVGAPALICFAFASYSGIYSGLLFLDYGVFRNNFLPIRWLLVLLLIAVSVWNHDHPVNMRTTANPQRNPLTAQFATWFSDYKAKMDRTNPGIKKYPVVFICAEGGAFRTGAYTSIFLTRLQHDLNSHGLNFKGSIFSMSGVSGGSLGLAYYNAKAFGDDQKKFQTGADITDAINFYKYDCLSPIVGKMLFGDFLNLFLPWHIQRFDRSIALEESWKQAYQQTLTGKEVNRFSADFIDGKRDPLKPLLIINTTEIESGYQCWLSNTTPDSILYQQKRDLLYHKVKQLSYSTAVNFSTRFPLLSPGAEIDTVGGRFHYLDGGYVENTGAGSTLEVLNLLDKKFPLFADVVPIVIYLRFSNNDNAAARNIHTGNEFTEVINGIYNTRVGRSFTAMAQLNHFVQLHQGIIIDEPLSRSDRDVPMNWMLSDQSIQNILGDINEKLKDTSAKGIKVRLFRQGLRYLPAN